MDIELIGKDILNCAYAIHSRFGSGLLEKAYRIILASELRRLGFVINFGMASLKDEIERIVNNR